MNLLESLSPRPPQERAAGRIVRGPYWAGDETKPTGRPKCGHSRAAVLAALERGPTTKDELCRVTGLNRTTVCHVLRSLLRDAAVECEHTTTERGRLSIWRGKRG